MLRRIVYLFRILLVLCLPLYMALSFWNEHRHASFGQDIVPFTEYVKEAIEFKRQEINAVAQLNILVVGALWALIIGSKALPHRSMPSYLWTLFVIANLSLALSYVLYVVGIDGSIEYLVRANNLDLYSPALSLYFKYQIFAFSLGVGYGLAFTLIFYFKTRRDKV